jgi:hypothetical protein
MLDSLTDEEKKARRAEVNRRNAQKSTGPKSPESKLVTRLNGLKHGAFAKVIDLSDNAGLALLSGEGVADYQAMVAEFAQSIGPRDNVEMGIAQRIADAQWRLLRNSRTQTLFFENCLSDASQIEHPGLEPFMLGAVDTVAATEVAIESKVPQELRREEAALVRLISASLRELQQWRKLNPQPKTPTSRRARIIAPAHGPVEEILKADSGEVAPEPEAAPTPETAHAPQLRGWLPRPTAPLRRAAGQSTVDFVPTQ